MILVKDRESKFIIQLLIGIILFCYIAHRLGLILTYFSLSLFLAYFFGPLYRFLLTKRISKTLSILIIFAIIITFTVLVIFFLIPNTINELNQLYREIPGLISGFQDLLLSFEFIFEFIEDSTNLEVFLQDIFEEIQIGMLTFSRNAIFELSSFVTKFGFGVIVIPIILYYLLIDLELFKDNLLIFVSEKNKKSFREIVIEIDRILSNFIRGRLIVCFIVGALITLGLYFLQIKFYLIIGLVSGILNFIPYLGPIIGWVLSLFFVIGKPWSVFILVTILFVAVNQIEALWLNPKILGKEMGLHPLTIIFAVMTFGGLLGFLGVLYAIPLAATLKVVMYRYLVQEEKVNC
ncbi:MAG: AI-2E family transporter [Candidatus Caldatribacteriota bacterium]|jgi:predicted PurR-regulated permease PerM|nr:AI-2E family transporter [Atribacterota bacterium]MDD3032334.1 AI-2E family transporter [Atribacterota bacterium]MDD3640286.1 AI-2E family transporter [Atribacterota bacterium]MDD4288455.1 AI-2E family transporter [Atribacterota bacterium]MDD4764354.1 AI-2E family transporter [Atribacterota bacterium]